MSEQRQTAGTMALSKQLILLLGIPTGLLLFGADIYYSYLPLRDITGPLVAMAISIFSCPVEMLATVYATEDTYRRTLAKRELILVLFLGATAYLYDVGTNVWGLLQAGMSSTNWEIAVCVALSIFLAFIEHLLSLLFAVVVGKSVISGFLARINPRGNGGRPGYEGRGGPGRQQPPVPQPARRDAPPPPRDRYPEDRRGLRDDIPDELRRMLEGRRD